ncbi:MAG: hypothetical protein CMK07_02825 [Ponticaulis sp.]|nr:hypothetical protein [Ponticaulis sp.]
MKSVTRYSGVFAVLSLIAFTARASTNELPKVSLEASCDAWGTPAICTSEWTAGLNQKLRVQTYRITHAETGDTLFAGRGVYRLDGGAVTGYWEDSQASIHRLTGSWKGDVLEVVWGDADAPVGKSRYDFSDGGMTAEDWSHTAAGWQSFMVISYPD